MARMIPSEIYSGCASPGEREIFRRLKNDPSTKDWIVCHSLDIAEHRQRISGEIDFIVLIPRKGVLCLEVKACTKLRRENGSWYYGTDPEPDHRGPFKQASQGMHSLREALRKRGNALSSIPFWSAVSFPFTSFSERSPEWHDWQVFDMRLLTSQPIGRVLESILDQARAFLASRPNALWFRHDSEEPTIAQCQELAHLIRGDFEYYESPKNFSKRMSEEVRRYTAEQFDALDAMETNPRAVFAGPAGTGKTLLAIECVRRSIAAKKRVLFICYNRLLGLWLSDQVAPLGGDVWAGTFHRYLLAVAKTEAPKGADHHYWDNELPQKALNKLILEQGGEHQFDELVIDEGQDLLRDGYQDVLDLSLKGGFSAGRWRMFGDFEKQAIYQSSPPNLGSFYAGRGNNPPTYSLRANCRNVPRISALTEILAGLSPGYSRTLRPDNGIEPEPLFYGDSKSQLSLLTTSVRNLLKEGFRPQDIVVLSTRNEDDAVSASLQAAAPELAVRPFATGQSGCIQTASIHGFKGLEAPAVILTDIDRIGLPESPPLFYVGITRALHRLVLLMHQEVKAEIAGYLTRKA